MGVLLIIIMSYYYYYYYYYYYWVFVFVLIFFVGFLLVFYNSGMYARAYNLFYILYLNMTIISNKSYD